MDEDNCVQYDIICENKRDQAQLEDRSLPATISDQETKANRSQVLASATLNWLVCTLTWDYRYRWTDPKQKMEAFLSKENTFFNTIHRHPSPGRKQGSLHLESTKHPG